jgi:hypothetical protein
MDIDSKWIDRVLIVVLLICLLAVLYLGAITLYDAVVVTPKCLANGYPTSYITITWQGYCTRFVDATQQLVPIELVGK